MHTTLANELQQDDRLSPDTPVHEDTRLAIRRHYPESAFRGPLLEGRDRIALAMATVMLIAPLAAMPLGLAG